MESVRIEYCIRLPQGRSEHFLFNLESKNFDLITRPLVDPPAWTALGFRQCSLCPLTPKQTPHCPLALHLHDLVERFHDTCSIDEVELEVVTEERRVIQRLAIQQAIASMLDLLWPICGCPVTTNMKPLARFHLPVASEEETVFRVTGMYLLAQYFLSHNHGDGCIDLKGLTRIYSDYHILNKAVASRLREVTHSDSLKNAIALIDMYSLLVPALLEDQLAEMRPFFSAYLAEIGGTAPTSDHLKKAKAFRLELVPMEVPPPIKMDEIPEAEELINAISSPDSPGGAVAEGDDAEAKRKAEQSAAIATILGGSSLSLELEPVEPKSERQQRDALFYMEEAPVPPPERRKR